MDVAGRHNPPAPAWRSGGAAMASGARTGPGSLGGAGYGGVNLLRSTASQRHTSMQRLCRSVCHLTGRLCWAADRSG